MWYYQRDNILVRNHSRNFSRNEHLFKIGRRLAVEARRHCTRKLGLNYDNDFVVALVVLSSREQNNRGGSPDNNCLIQVLSSRQRFAMYATRRMSLYHILLCYGDLMRNLMTGEEIAVWFRAIYRIISHNIKISSALKFDNTAT